MTGSRCGNNPNTRLSDADRTAVTEFKEYLAAKAAVVRVRDLHSPFMSGFSNTAYCAHCNQLTGGWIPYPCPTIQALENTP
jgi:hypothetical protein